MAVRPRPSPFCRRGIDDPKAPGANLAHLERALRDTAERARRHELERAQRRLAHGADPQQVLDELSQALTNKFMHPPSHALNHAAQDERDELAALIARLYQIQRPE